MTAEQAPLESAARDGKSRPSRGRQLVELSSHRYVRLFFASEMAGLLLAIMTGPQGNAAAPTSGITGSLSFPRVLWFLGFGLVLFGLRVVWTVWGQAIKSWTVAQRHAGARRLRGVSPRIGLEVLIIALGFGWVTWLAPNDTWKGGVCIEIGAALLVTEVVLWLFQDFGQRWARIAAYAGFAAYGALAWMGGASSRYLNRIGAVPHNPTLGHFLMVSAGILCGIELLLVPVAVVNRRVDPNLARKAVATLGIAALVYGWLQWTSWAQWSQATPDSFAHWLLTHHVLVHDHTSGLVVMAFGALGILAAMSWLLAEARASTRPSPTPEDAATGAALMSVRRISRISFGRPALTVAILLIVLQWPLHMDPGSQSNIDLQILPLALLALGLNVVIGFAGLLDLGYVAFYAIGAYTAGYFTGTLPIQPPSRSDSARWSSSLR